MKLVVRVKDRKKERGERSRGERKKEFKFP
jgi:hypothetical protein